MNNIKFTILENNIVNTIPIVINSTNNNDSLNTVRSSDLGGTKFYYCTTCPLSKDTGDLGHHGKLPLPMDKYIIKPCYIKLLTNFLNTIKICPSCLMLKNNIILSDILKKHNYVYSKELKEEILNEFKNKQNIKCLNPNCDTTYNATFKFNYLKCNFLTKIKNKNIEIAIPLSKIYNILTGIHKLIYKCLTPITSYKEINPSDCIYTDAILIPSIYTRIPVIYDNKESNIITSKLNQLVSSVYYTSIDKNKTKNYCITQQILNELDNDKGISPYKKTNLVNLDIQVGGTRKLGLLRGHIVARREDNSARCVASPNDNEDIGYINIPIYIANKLVNSIYYNKFSEDYIKNLLENTGLVKYIIFKDVNSDINNYKLIKIKNNLKTSNFLRLRYGDRVEIALNDYDCVLFSRQPSLHKFNIQASTIKIWNNNTIGISTAVTNSFNGDFDGDEMNIQKLLINDFEAMVKMSAPAIFKNNYNMSPIFGLIQDQLIAIHTLYKLENISRNNAIMLLGKYSYFIKDIHKQNYTGKELLSLIFPDNLSYNKIFKNGILILDSINSEHLVFQSYDALINIVSQYSNDILAISILNVLIHISINFLSIYGFSVTLDDLIPDIKFLKNISNFISNGLVIINSRINKYTSDNINKIYYDYDLEYIRNEDCITLIKDVKEQVIDMYNTKNNKFNSILRMKDVKYKVNDNELTTIIGMGGYPYSNENIPKKSVMGRCFYLELPGNNNPKSYGLIESSLLKGNSFLETSYICKYLSLINIVKVTCETSMAGSIGRKLVKFMENVIIDSYGMVILNNRVISHNYNFIKIMGSNTSKVQIIYPDKKMSNYNIIKKLFDNLKPYLIYDNGKKLIKEIIFPINIKIFLESYIQNKDEKEISDLNLQNKIDTFVLQIQIKIYLYLTNLEWLSYILFVYLNKLYLSSINKKLTYELVDYILDKIQFKLYTSINAGYPIGLEYAHNIQEKFTQQSLSSFHTHRKSGVQAKKLGFSDFKDTVELGKKNKHDLITLYSNDYNKLLHIKKQLEYIDLELLDSEMNIEYDSEYIIYTVNIYENKILNKINIYNLTDMFYNFLENCNIIKSFWITLDIDNVISYKFGIKLQDPININEYFFKIGIRKGISKGKIENTNLVIEDINVYNRETLLEEKSYSLSLYINNITDLSYFNTENIYIEMGYWFTMSTNGIQFAEHAIHNKLLKSTNEENMENCYRLLSKVMCMDMEATSIKKLKDSKNSIIKSAIHGIPDSIINASWNNIAEDCNDIYSNIFCGNKPKISHGYYNYYYDINQYNRLILKQKEISVDKDILIQDII